MDRPLPFLASFLKNRLKTVVVSNYTIDLYQTHCGQSALEEFFRRIPSMTS